MKTITFYEVGDAYDCEGRGPFQVIGRFTDVIHASKYAEGRGNYGHRAQVRGPHTLHIADSIEEVEAMKKKEETTLALKKLSDKEVALLQEHFRS